jgi:hypothetical protein
MAGYIGSKSSVTLVDGYSEAEADAEFVNDPNGAITVSGSNVGIGTSSTDNKVNIQESALAGRGASNGNTSMTLEHATDTGIQFFSAGQTQLRFGDAASTGAGSIIYEHATDKLRLNTGSLTTFEDGGVERMRIDSSGNVGIGTSSGTAPLEISNSATNSLRIHRDFATNSASSATIRFAGDDSVGNVTDYAEIRSFTEVVTNGSEAGALLFGTLSSGSVTERMRIDSSGNLLVGAVASKSNIAKSFIEYSSASQYGLEIHATSASVPATQIAFYQNNNYVGAVQSTASATSYTTSSDYRLKEAWLPMAGASERVQALKPINFAWKVDGSRVDGFLAHEVQEVVPEAATGAKDAMRDEEYEVTPAVYEDVVIPAVLDEEGTEVEAERTEQTLVTEAVMGTRSVPDYQGIDQSKLVPLLTAALQEALTEIASLKTRVEALEA